MIELCVSTAGTVGSLIVISIAFHLRYNSRLRQGQEMRMTMMQQHMLDVTRVFIHSYLRQYIKLTNVYKLNTLMAIQALMELIT